MNSIKRKNHQIITFKNCKVPSTFTLLYNKIHEESYSSVFELS